MSYLKLLSVIKSPKHLSFVYWHGPPRFPFFLFSCSKFGIKGWYSILASFIELHQSQWEFYTKIKDQLWPWSSHLRLQNRPPRLSSVPGKRVVLNLTLRKSFQLLACSEEASCFYDWLLSSGEGGKWSDATSPVRGAPCIFCGAELRRLITLMSAFISCHDSRLKILRPGKRRTGMGIALCVENTMIK